MHKKNESRTFDRDLDGPAYTAMRKKWLPTLRKYSIVNTPMASPEMIRGEFEPQKSKLYGIY
jgi:hypothetical protein